VNIEETQLAQAYHYFQQQLEMMREEVAHNIARSGKSFEAAMAEVDAMTDKQVIKEWARY
jgi:hypothetical protein